MLEIAKNILKREAFALEEAALSLDESFIKIANLVNDCKGNLIVVGVGKSGIVGRKIAASFASCGVKSFFIHASELMHGDLGNISKEDLVILISFSGKSEEVLKIIPFLKDRACTLISISQSNSPLANSCLFNIATNCNEAITNLPAPTSSTTLTLALADALLACVIALRDFSVSDFGINHPGGALGKRYYVKVSDLMHKNNLPIINKDANLKEAILCMSKASFGCALIVDNEKLLGFLSDGDLRRAMGQDNFSLEQLALTYASKNPKTIIKTELAHKAFSYMKENKISILVVVEDEKIIGLLQLLDE